MKRSFYFFILLLPVVSCVNDPGKNTHEAYQSKATTDSAVIWEKMYFGKENDRPHEIKIGSNNRIYILGQRFQRIDSTSEYSADVMVCLDMNGEKLWERALGNYQASRMMSFDMNDKNELVIVGSYYENKEAVMKSDCYGWIIKLDADGKLIKEKKYGGFFNRIKRSGNDFIVTGSLVPMKGLSMSTCLKVFKIDTALSVKWATSLADGTDCKYSVDGYNLCINDKGEIAVIGSAKPPAKKDELGYDAAIVKFSKDGKKLWYKYYAVADGYDLFKSVTWKDSVYYTCGMSGDKVGSDLDIIICSFDESGNLKTTRKYGGSETEYANCIKVWNDQLFAVGFSQSHNGYFKKNVRYADNCVLRMNMYGQLLHITSFGTERTDQMVDFVVQNDTMYVAGVDDRGAGASWKLYCMKMK